MILTNSELTSTEEEKDTLIIKDADQDKIKDSIDYAEAHPFHSSIILHSKDIGSLFRQFKEFFQVIEAAGGMVWSPEGALLLIYRHQRWDLPKGKIEAGEDPDEAAKREVKEECGIRDLHLNGYVQASYHTFWQHDQRVLKITYWFDILCQDPQNINPQTEEGIETIRWVDNNGLEKALENTFPNLQMLFRVGLDKMR